MKIAEVKLGQEVVWIDPDGGEVVNGVVWAFRDPKDWRDEDSEIVLLVKAGLQDNTTLSVVAGDLHPRNEYDAVRLRKFMLTATVGDETRTEIILVTLADEPKLRALNQQQRARLVGLEEFVEGNPIALRRMGDIPERLVTAKALDALKQDG